MMWKKSFDSSNYFWERFPFCKAKENPPSHFEVFHAISSSEYNIILSPLPKNMVCAEMTYLPNDTY